jgi:hypothetical protein
MKRFAATLAVVLLQPMCSAGAAPAGRSAETIPVLDVRPVCRGIAGQSSDPGVGQNNHAKTFKQCIESEQAVREQLKKGWNAFSAEDKRHCSDLARTGGEGSNTELLTCLEMARDVRVLKSAAASAPSKVKTTKSTPPSTPAPPPRAAALAAEPSPATSKPAAPTAAIPEPLVEHSNPSNNVPTPSAKQLQAGTDRQSREIERAKDDARAAEATATSLRRELVETETALQLAKEEAARATAQAEQAKADAKIASDSEAATKRKLTDLEAARASTESAPAPSGSKHRFLDQVRGWFGPSDKSP